jgi:hypothetical protein
VLALFGTPVELTYSDVFVAVDEERVLSDDDPWVVHHP